MSAVDPTLGVVVVNTGILLTIAYRQGSFDSRITANRRDIDGALRTDGGEDVDA